MIKNGFIKYFGTKFSRWGLLTKIVHPLLLHGNITFTAVVFGVLLTILLELMELCGEYGSTKFEKVILLKSILF